MSDDVKTADFFSATSSEQGRPALRWNGHGKFVLPDTMGGHQLDVLVQFVNGAVRFEREHAEPPAHVIIEASEPGPGSDFDWALTIAWPDGTETLEMVSDHAAKLLGYDVEESDGTKPPRPLTAAQQATLDLNNRAEPRA